MIKRLIHFQQLVDQLEEEYSKRLIKKKALKF